MKQILSFFLATILSFNLVALPKATTANYTFTIHIGAFIKAHPADFEEIKPYGFLYAERINNLLQVYMGDYPSEGLAMKVLDKVKRHNYPDAFITRRDLSKGKDLSMIQLTTKNVGESIDWQYYASAGKLFAIQENNVIKILTGSFDSNVADDAQLRNIKAAGFKDAFAKNVNEVLLHPITEFEAGKVLNYNKNSTVTSTNTLTDNSTPKKTVARNPAQSLFVVPPKAQKEPSPSKDFKEADVLTAKEVVLPKSYDVIEERITPPPSKKTTPAPTAIPKPEVKSKPIAKPKPTVIPKPAVKPTVAKISLPKTRGNVKRNSAYNLQMLMKQEGVYSNSLDGFYGAGTKKGWEAIQQTNAQLKKYILLTGLEDELVEKSAAHILQHYINTLDEDPKKAINALKNSDEAVAKAYQAYALFAQKGPDKAVNDLMNTATKAAFSNKKLENKPPFDYTAAYDYKNIDQLILHLRYIQSAATEQVETPAWLFLKHPKAVQDAFEPYAEFIDDSYPIQNALILFDWPEFTLLETILKDLDTNPNQEGKKNDQYLRSRLLIAPKNLSQDAHVSIKKWNNDLWVKMDTWGGKDELHLKLLTPLKLTYFQTLVRLEDYYMDKGFDSRIATALGLKVMKTFMERPLEKY